MDKKGKRKKIRPYRVPVTERAPAERVQDFREVPLGYTVSQARDEAGRCLNCKNRPCKGGCPVGIDCGGFVAKVHEGDFLGAVKLVKEKNLLPAVTGRVCPQVEQCEGPCVIGKKGTSVGIGNLERFVADWEREHGVVLPDKAPPTGMSVGIVGSGPSGLTVAADMIQFGHSVTIYEGLHEPGGVLVYGIPEFRLPKSIVAEQIASLTQLGVEIEMNQIIGKTLTVDDLLQIHDAVFIGVGAGAPIFMGIPGENLIGVYSANEFLTRSNLMRAYKFPEWDTPMRFGKKIAVIGGGNVAMDAARTALRLGATDVSVIYRRSREEMPSRDEEIRHGEEEGLQFDFLKAPTKIIGDENGIVVGIKVIDMKLTEPDASGRRRPVPVEGLDQSREVDTVIVAIGQRPNPTIASTTPGLEVDNRGYLMVDKETMATTREGVYAGGDIVGWGASVIRAMGDGRKAARAMHDYLTLRS
ncbi:MAG TPA: NADPH-dependent glutamate synthase [Desulfobacteraceae bacterium]|nr:NADPH-dependent glutamate synthase [Desulfobacteraceae bacterium]